MDATLPFSVQDVIATIEAHSPTRVDWEIGPGGATSHDVALSIEVTGEGSVRQSRYPDGSICGGESEILRLPVVVDTAIGGGKITQRANLILVAHGVELSEMKLQTVDGEPFPAETEAVVDPEWAEACALANPESFGATPYIFWLLYDHFGLEDLQVSVAGGSDEGSGWCFIGTIPASTSP